eukprot:4463247-Pleurochrysis_carterae.AAC.3
MLMSSSILLMSNGHTTSSTRRCEGGTINNTAASNSIWDTAAVRCNSKSRPASAGQGKSACSSCCSCQASAMDCASKASGVIAGDVAPTAGLSAAACLDVPENVPGRPAALLLSDIPRSLSRPCSAAVQGTKADLAHCRPARAAAGGPTRRKGRFESMEAPYPSCNAAEHS